MMKLHAMRALAAGALLGLLSGCGGGSPPEKKTVELKPRPAPEAPAKAPEPAAPKGLGVSQAQALAGLDGQIKVEQLDMKTSEGLVYKGTATGGSDAIKPASLVLYGSPETVTHAYFTVGLPFADFPDAANYPDAMKSNLAFRDKLLANLLGGTVPPDVAAALEWSKDNPGKDKSVPAGKLTVKVSYGADKKMVIDVK